MLKQEFLDCLRKRLSGLPKGDLEERLSFYGEMIDDRIDEGRTEEEAVADIGSTDEIAAQIISEIPLTRITKEKIKPKRKMKAWEIVLLAVGSPIWVPLAIAALVILLSLYIVLWSLVLSVWAVFVALAASALCVAVISVAYAFSISPVAGIAMIGAALFCAGLAIFLFFGSIAATKGAVLLAKKIIFGIKKSLVGKENA